MKKLLTLMLLVFTAGLFAQNQPDDDFENIVCKEAGAHSHFFLPPPAANLLTENYDLKYYRFEWNIDPAFYYIEGKATVYFETLADNFGEINFDFSSQLAIDSIIYHGQGLTDFTSDGNYLLTVQLPGELASGTLDSLTIAYAGAPPSGGFGSFVQGDHNGSPVLWTLSEPFGSQDWWPCKNGLDDKIDSIDVYISTPETYRAASNGTLVAEIAGNFIKTYHWKHRYPIAPYLVAIAVTNYVQYTDNVPLSNGTDLPMVNYVYPENLANAQTGTGNLVQVLQFYDSLFVTYPFFEEKYGHAQFGWGGGMEHQTMSFVTGYGWGLLSHELAHQWFGDMVTCGSWEDIWLNEGFATYLEGLTRERFPTQTLWYDWKQDKINSIVSQPDGSVLVDDTTSVDRIFSGRLSYNKGAYLLHMLRWKLGDDDFFSGIRNYLGDRQFKYAVTASLQAHLEAVSGQDLTGFFADWFTNQGYPSYHVTWSDLGDKVWIKLEQTTSHPSVDFFEMPVPILVLGAGMDTILRLENTFSGQEYEIELPFGASIVRVDPDLWLVSALNTVVEMPFNSTAEENLLRSILISPNPFAEVLNIRLIDNLAQVEKIEIKDVLGRAYYQNTQLGSEVSIDANHWPSGTYFLTIYAQSGTATKTVVKI